MSELIVYTYGVGEFAAQVFNAVAATIGSDDFKSVLKIAFLMASVIATYRYILTRSILDLAKNIFLYIGVTGILLIPSKNLIIKDEVIGNSFHVSNVPIGLSYPAYLVSTVFYGLTRLVEIPFHFSNDLNYSKTGFLFASHVVRNSAQVQITDPNMNQSLKSFINNCIFYDVYLGSYTFKDLLTTDNIWELVTKKASGNRSFELNGQVTVCKDGVSYFNRQWSNEIDNSISEYAKMILPFYKSNSNDIKAKVLSSIGDSYSYLTKSSQNAADILKQNILINAINDAAENNPEGAMYSYAVARANAQKSIANISTGIMIARWLPAMQGTMECMMYAFFVLVAIYALFTHGEKVISNYISTLIWLASWPVVYAVMNFGFTWIIAFKSSGLGLSFYDNSALSQIQSDMASLFGYFSLSVPLFALGLLKLGRDNLGSVFTQMSHLVGNSTQSLAMAASGEAVTGNYSFGNTSFENHSMYNTSGFKHDSNASFSTGSTTSMLASGSTITTTTDGTSVLNMESGMSRLNTGINFQDRISSSISNQADNSLSFAKGNQLSWAENMLSSIRQVEDVGTMLNSSTNSGDSYSLSSSSGFQKSATDYASAIEKFAHDNNMSQQDAGRYLAGAYVNASAHVEFGTDKQIIGKVVELTTGSSGGVRVSTGTKGEADRSWTTTDSESFQKAQEFIKNNNLSETLDKAIRGVQEERYQTDNRSGAHFNENIAASLDAAKQASINFSKNYQESISYRDAATFAKDNSSSININANQDFIEYVAKQSLANSNNPMGIHQAEAILKSDHQLRELYAKDFIVQKTDNYLKQFKQVNNISEDNVKAHNTLDRDYAQSTNQLVQDNFLNKGKIDGNTSTLNLKNTFSDESIQSKVKADLASHTRNINNMMEQHEIKQQDFKNIITDKIKSNPQLERPVNKILDLVEDS